MNRIFLRLLIPLTVWLCTVAAFGEDTRELLVPAPWPATFIGQHPASFFRIDTGAFAKARLLADDETMTITVSLPRIGTLQLIVARYRVIDQNTVLTAMTDIGPQPIPAPQSVLLRGRVATLQNSHVILAVYPDWCMGQITTGKLAGNFTYTISPLPKGAGPQTMVLYDLRDVPQSHEWNCSTIDPKHVIQPLNKNGEETQAPTYRKITVAIECDEPFYIDHGRNITNATQYAEAVTAASSAIYERDVTATFSISSLVVWTVVDPYTSNLPDEMLVQFRDRWRALNGAVNRSTALLLSGTNGIGGIAYVDQLCNKQWAYSVIGTNNNVTYPAAGYVWDTDVYSHELGHNIGSPHTHSCTWSPPIDSCYTSEGGCFTGTKAINGTIMSYCHLTTQGTKLEIHSRVVTLMKSKLLNNVCTPLVSVFSLTLDDFAEVCDGTAVSLTANVIGGVGRITYRWRGTNFDTTTTTNSFQFVPRSNFKMFLTVTDSVGSVVQDSCLIRVNAKPLIQLITTAHRVCSGTVVEIGSTITNGRVPYTYRWTRNGVLIDTLMGIVWPRVNASGVFQLVVTDLNGCKDTADISITVPDQQLAIRPSTLVTPDLAVCEDQFATVVELRNTGSETIVIDSLWTGNSISAITQLPITVMAGQAESRNVIVTVRRIGALRDTITFFDQACNTGFKIPLSGTRDVSKVMSTMPVDLGAQLSCEPVTARQSSVRISNPSAYPVDVVSVSGKLVGADVALASSPFTIAPRSEGTVPFIATIKRLPGIFLDTLTFVTSSVSCEGLLIAAITARVVGITIDFPSSVSFDTVKSSDQARSKQFNVVLSLIGAPSTAVSSVEVVGPFTTTMQRGLALQHAKPSVVGVSVDPSQFTTSGVVVGSLAFTLDSCDRQYVVALSAIATIVSVDESDQPSLDDFLGRAAVYDVRGVFIRSFECDGTCRPGIEMLPRGVYLVVFTSTNGDVTRQLISR